MIGVKMEEETERKEDGKEGEEKEMKEGEKKGRKRRWPKRSSSSSIHCNFRLRRTCNVGQAP